MLFLSRFCVRPSNTILPYLAFSVLILGGCHTLPSTNPAPAHNVTQATQPLSALLPSDTVTYERQNRFETTLDNGLRIIVQQDKRAPVVMTQLWYKVGSIDEPKDKGGISHLLEHMMFKGTDMVSGDDFSRLISNYGGQNNAFTSYDYTGYYELFPANRVNLALELEADRMTNLVLTEADYLAEREVVMEERRQRTDDNPDAQAYEQFRLLAMPDSPKGESVIGPMSEIASITLADLQDWYQKWYAPNNATLVIVGDVNPEHVFATAKRYFASIPARPLPRHAKARQPAPIGYREQTVQLPVQVPKLMLAFNVPSLTTADSPQTAYALALLADVLDGGKSARLETKLVREEQLLTSVGTSYSTFARGDGLFMVTATPREGVTLSKIKQRILAEIEALKSDPIQPIELQRAKTSLLTSLIYHQDSIQGQAQLIGSLNTVGLDDRLLDDYPQQLSQVPLTQLYDTAQTYFTKDNLTVMYVEPESPSP